MATPLILLMGALTARGVAAAKCDEQTLDFIINEGDATHEAIADDIASDLAKVGLTVNARYLSKDDLNTAMVDGDYDMLFSETWGAPYDPHSYVSSWTTPDEAHYSAMESLDGKLEPSAFADWVDEILQETDSVKRQANWTDLLTEVHEEVLHLPVYGKRIPSVVNKRLSGYSPGYQQFDYPIQDITVNSGSKNITVAPGAQTGRFTTVGRLDPHSYRPNEFFANNWVYEGLVKYGANGAVEPSLASSWTVTKDSSNIETITFSLRQGVKFHDGAKWNCSVAKLNFDHFFAEPLRSPWWHGWYGLPEALESWSCTDEYTFVIVASKPYYPLLQELTYIRPTRMLSPLGFVGGAHSSPISNNSCPVGWGKATCTTDDGWEGTDDCLDIRCAGTVSISGTGPFEFISRTNADDDEAYDDEVVFKSFDNYWGGDSEVDYVTIKRYDSASDIYDALIDESLDAVVGAGVLEPSDVHTLMYNDDFAVEHTDAIMNSVVILNGKLDKDVRKTVVHAVNKGYIIDKELGGIEKPVSQLFPESAPFCDVYLTPKADYDYEKAKSLNCNSECTADGTEDDDGGILGMSSEVVTATRFGLVGASVLAVASHAIYGYISGE